MSDAAREPRYYSDDDVERLFGVSSSKLRTAQRLGLVESYSELQHGRYIRVWDEASACKAYVATLMSDHLAVSYQVASCLLVAYNDALPDPTEIARRFRCREFGDDPSELRFIYEADRKWLFTRLEGSASLLGLIGHDEANRMALNTPSEKTKLPSERTFLSVIRFDVLRATNNFIEIADG